MPQKMRAIYSEIQQRLDQIDFPSLWPGFTLKEFALYNDDWVILENSQIPKDNRFLGNTAIEYEGRFMAIWYLSETNTLDLDDLTANLVHEMFHVLQKEAGETRYPNELEMLDYPVDITLYQLKHMEIERLIQARHEPEARSVIMQEYCAYKKYRLQNFGHVMRNELYVETVEGMAEYVGLLALKQLSESKFDAKVINYCEILTDNRYLFDVRRLGYFVGAMQLLLLHEVGVEVYHQIGATEDAVFELVARRVKAEKPTHVFNEEIDQLARDHQSDKERAILEFLENEVDRTELQARITGFDPMNMIKVGPQILCHHFINLQIDDERHFIKGPVLLEVDPDSVYNIVALTNLK